VKLERREIRQVVVILLVEEHLPIVVETERTCVGRLSGSRIVTLVD
jgi:hypothetical protein